MRFVASTIFSVVILAFVAQSVSAVPVGSTENVGQVNQKSSSILKRNELDDLLEACGAGLAPPEACDAAFSLGPF